MGASIAPSLSPSAVSGRASPRGFSARRGSCAVEGTRYGILTREEAKKA
jgi:hypothetical protein